MSNGTGIRWFRNLPIQKKIRIVIIIACTLVLAIFAAANLLKDISMVKQAMLEKHKVLATVMTDNIIPGMVFNDPESVKKNIDSLRQEPSIHHVGIYLMDKRPYMRFTADDITHDHRNELHNEVLGVTGMFDRCPFEIFEQQYLHVCRIVSFKDEKLGYLLTSAYTAELDESLQNNLATLAVVLVLSLSVAFLLARPVSQMIADPLVKLTSLMREVTRDRDYSVRSDATGKDEIGVLADGLNTMLEEIEKRDNRLRFYNLELERNVAERTLELEKVVNQLKVARDRAESASMAKSSFLSSMSHELRTPLSSVIGYAQLFQHDPLLNDDQKRGAQAIYRAGKHLLSLIEDILDLSRIESGSLSISNDVVSVHDLLSELDSLVQTLLEKFSVKLYMELDDCAEQYVIADFTRLKQVMVNLVSNAIKYNRPNGDVWVKCQAVDDMHVRLLVEDTGKGLSEEQVKHLFEPFNRLDADKGNIEGTGIGLVITRRLTELMHGTVGVESEKGRGSTFWVELQRAEASWQDKREESFEDCQLDPSTISSVLYIEDNPETARLMESVFAAHYPWVDLQITPSGEAGLERLHEHDISPDVVLLDINLPGINGYEVLLRIRMNGETENLLVVGFSANAMSEDIKKALNSGFDAYLTKPVDTEQLQKTLYHLLSKRANGTATTD